MTLRSGIACTWRDNSESSVINIPMFFMLTYVLSAKFKVIELQMFFVDMLKSLNKVGHNYQSPQPLTVVK